MGVYQAAGNRQSYAGVWLFYRFKGVELVNDPVLGTLAYHTAIKHNEIGIFSGSCGLVALLLQGAADSFRFRLIHLAAYSPDIILGHSPLLLAIENKTTYSRGIALRLAEGVGFEPTTPVSQGKRLAGARTRPLCDPSSSL